MLRLSTLAKSRVAKLTGGHGPSFPYHKQQRHRARGAEQQPDQPAVGAAARHQREQRQHRVRDC